MRRDLAFLLVLAAMVAAGAWLLDSVTRHELPPPLAKVSAC